MRPASILVALVALVASAPMPMEHPCLQRGLTCLPDASKGLDETPIAEQHLHPKRGLSCLPGALEGTNRSEKRDKPKNKDKANKTNKSKKKGKSKTGDIGPSSNLTQEAVDHTMPRVPIWPPNLKRSSEGATVEDCNESSTQRDGFDPLSGTIKAFSNNKRGPAWRTRPSEKICDGMADFLGQKAEVNGTTVSSAEARKNMNQGYSWDGPVYKGSNGIIPNEDWYSEKLDSPEGPSSVPPGGPEYPH